MRRTSIAGLGTALVIGLSASPVTATADQQTVAINWHAQSGFSGAVANRATATLIRRSDGVSFRFQTEDLLPGHAYTLWVVVVNNPDACSAAPCPPPQIILNPATNGTVTYGAGGLVGASGQGTFAGSIAAGPLTDGWLAGRGLEDPFGAEIHLVLNDHGVAMPAYLPGMIQTYRAGCTDASLVPFFPPSAFADGEPGPNTCRLYQAAIFGGA